MRQLLLITGERLVVTAAGAGRQAVAAQEASAHDAVTSLRLGGELLEVPGVALPYLGRGLSPALFELSALEQAESGGRLPVSVAFTGQHPAIPGLTITRSAAGHASGYLTATSARAFGAALSRQYAADHARGSYGTDGIFARHVSISLGSAATPASTSSAARPAFRMHRLTLRGADLRGRPDTGDFVFLQNVDSTDRYLSSSLLVFYHGTAKVAVPAGHYWAVAVFGNIDGAHPAPVRMVVLSQFTVAGRATTVRFAARSATSKMTVTTPRPVVNPVSDFEIIRGTSAGQPSVFQEIVPQATFYVSPTHSRPTVGTLRSYTGFTLASPAKVSPGYGYNLEFPGPPGAIPARQQFTVKPADLGAISERFYQNVPARFGLLEAIGGTAAQLNLSVQGYWATFFRTPQRQTQYFSAGHGLVWGQYLMTDLLHDRGYIFGGFQSFTGGEHQSQDWNAYPLHPGPDTSTNADSEINNIQQPSADRTGNILHLLFFPFSDNQSGHLSGDFGNNAEPLYASSYTVTQNGKKISSGTATSGIPAIRLSPRPSVISFVLNARQDKSRFFRLSTATRTVWTWHSYRDASARVPHAWYCVTAKVHGRIRLVRRCAVQHLLTLRYQVQGMSLTGLTTPGPQTVDVTAGHIQLGGTAAITRAAAQVSFNNGATWSAAKVTALGGGRFRLGYRAPAGTDVTLRVSATDSAGNSITETITRGYGVAK